MTYVGSKRLIAKYILPIILDGRLAEQYYVEPFVGGFNLMDKVDGPRIANDSNQYVMALFKAIQAGWQPPEYVSEHTYRSIRYNMSAYPAELVGFVGIACSYSGKWFGGYARGKRPDGRLRNYCAENKRALLKQAQKIQGVKILTKDYSGLEIPPASIIYCDPPYSNTVKYKENFDTEKFWEWAREKESDGHKVFVSEYQAPNDFECLWSKKVNNTLVQNTGSKQGIEKLFRKA